ncbi:MAG TPA: glycosyltransferase, partial [Patescibacteria group bacterium]|nr:glycosyltransferase [Patescibacteria group bacterium]
MTTKVGIIVLTFATPHWQADINRVLSSLEHINYPKESLELICVESQSPDHTRVKEWFESAWMTKSGQTLPRISYLFRDEVIGFAGNNNIGFEKARELGCEYVYLLNEDAEADPDFLLKAVERAEGDKKIAYVQSLILLGDRERVNTIGNAFHFLGFGYSNGYLWSKAQAIDHLNERRKSDPEL